MDEIRAEISSGIITRAIAEGETLETSCAALDVRFADLASVRQHSIESVLCVPIGSEVPHGVIYLQGSAGTFSPVDRARVEYFARELAVIAHRLTKHERPTLAEEMERLKMRRVREALARHDGNVGDAARELGVTRPTVYRALRLLRKSGV